MAVVASSCLVTGAPTMRSHVRIVSERSSTITTQGSTDGKLLKQGAGEVSSFVSNGVEKAGAVWWMPLFKVSTDGQWSDLLANSATVDTREQMRDNGDLDPMNSTSTSLPELISSMNGRRTRQNTMRVTFTAEKARALRKSLRETETWHDGWYHSAIASRLAEAVE